MSIKMVLKTCLLALNGVVTFGDSSVENLNNTIKNIKALIEAIEENERSSAHDTGDQQG